jgi:hypothetical protein
MDFIRQIDGTEVSYGYSGPATGEAFRLSPQKEARLIALLALHASQIRFPQTLFRSSRRRPALPRRPTLGATAPSFLSRLKSS